MAEFDKPYTTSFQSVCHCKYSSIFYNFRAVLTLKNIVILKFRLGVTPALWK